MPQYSCPFTLNFDGVCVPLIFNDMILWVGADEVLKILRLSHNLLHCLPECEKTTLRHLDPCCDSNKCYITALGVGLLVCKHVHRGSLIKDAITNDNSLPDKINAFANIFLTDVVCDIKTDRLLCSISKKENDILAILNEPLSLPVV
ncbi:ORF20 [Agrotis segetum granulovirus]|uniref:ORF20 n=1 Tax=Agrotis segetum granulosis virus TaxID=10464 RepID=Q6QXD9_GVAS|nr:p10 [Agrotis segetum granulovirus]AAS82718.1 ORF20 [Agrotis segetum granulovirus]AHN92060.1 pep-2 [Agrotis segetum granulovirus]AKN63295.1 p10 [Agrotis segetum granulovirus]